MAWTDEPTRTQIGAFKRLVEWTLDKEMSEKALTYLSTHTNRKEFSTEMGRIRDLYIDHKLDKDSCFDAPIWREFKEKNNIKEPSFSEVLAEIRRLNKEGNN